jgi:hypothetical protein
MPSERRHAPSETERVARCRVQQAFGELSRRRGQDRPSEDRPRLGSVVEEILRRRSRDRAPQERAFHVRAKPSIELDALRMAQAAGAKRPRPSAPQEGHVGDVPTDDLLVYAHATSRG